MQNTISVARRQLIERCHELEALAKTSFIEDEDCEILNKDVDGIIATLSYISSITQKGA